MNTNHLTDQTTSKSVSSLAKSRLLASAAAIAALIAGVATVSAAPLVLSGIFAYGWPLLHAAFNSFSEHASKTTKRIHTSAGVAR